MILCYNYYKLSYNLEFDSKSEQSLTLVRFAHFWNVVDFQKNYFLKKIFLISDKVRYFLEKSIPNIFPKSFIIWSL